MLIILAIILVDFEHIFAEDNVITVYYDKEVGKVNKKVFGNNFLGYDYSLHRPGRRHYYGYTDYGGGIWNPKQNRSDKEVIELAKEAGMSIVRFPGGCGTHHYNWKETIGERKGHYLYGIDEFMGTIEEIGAEAVITVSYFTGDEQDAADLVEYLNAPCDGVHEWSDRRAINGHPDQYNVKYFEIGNEIWHGNHTDIKKVLPEEYGYRYLKYYEAMKAVDPSIKIGVVLRDDNWNRRVLKIVEDKVDFGIVHTYPGPPVWRKELKQMHPDKIFGISLLVPALQHEAYFQRSLKLLKVKSGRELPLAITEFNGKFIQDEPFPYRHSLGTALLNAELLRIFMKPENRILMANYWQFSNGFFGMIKSKDDFMKHDYRRPINYIKRPNYYVYDLYNKYFGDVTIATEVKGSNISISKYKSLITKGIGIQYGSIIERNLLDKKWEIKKYQGVSAEEKNGVLLIDFNHPGKYNYFHSVKFTNIQPDTYYMMKGYIKTDMPGDKEEVFLEVGDGRGWKAAGVSAATEKISGTTDWQSVYAIYVTRSDANTVIVTARVIGNEGSLKGKAYFKDLRLEKYIPPNMQYLTVNGSKSKSENDIYLMVINKNMDEAVTAFIDIKNYISPEELLDSKGDAQSELIQVNAWTLNGPSIESTNEERAENVKVTHEQFYVNEIPFKFTYEPHSLTAIEISNN